MFRNEFDVRWETDIYGQKRHLNLYPHNEVVSFVFQNFAINNGFKGKIALDIGCGAGNNSLFLAQVGFELLAVDGSKSAINSTKKRISEAGLSGRVFLKDFSNLEFIKAKTVDLVIDRCSICHCRRSGIISTLEEIKRVLKPEGHFFSQVFSDAHSGAEYATVYEDGAAIEFSSGYFADIPQTYFASPEDIDDLYGSRFKLQSQILVTANQWGAKQSFVHWNLHLRHKSNLGN